MIQIINNEILQIQNFKYTILDWQRTRYRGDRIGGPKLVKACSITTFVESLPTFLGEDRMTNVGVHTDGPSLQQRLTTFVQRSTRLHQIVYNDNMFAIDVAILNDNGTQVAFPTGLATDNNFNIAIHE